MIDVEQPLHLLIDGRGLCRLLWVGPLTESGQLLSHLPGPSKRRNADQRRWRLISCLKATADANLIPESREAVVALDLQPESWMRYPCRPLPGGRWRAGAWRPDASADQGWSAVGSDQLLTLCQEELLPVNNDTCLLYTSPSPRDRTRSRMPSSA